MASNPNNSGVGLPAGTAIGKYEVVEMIGAGGQSVVYKCYDSLLDRHVAAKQISGHLAGNPGFMEQFRTEARLLARFGTEQPGIVTIHDLIENEHGLFIVMEYVEGQTLEAILTTSIQPIAPKAGAQLLWRLAGALAAVHNGGIIHRDLKPSNIIVAEGLRPKITDFGVATSLSGQTSMLMGTTKYMAPELFEGGIVDGRCDMYSLGMIIYELLLGREKFNEVFEEVLRDPRTASVRWMKWHGNPSVRAPALHEMNGAIPVELSGIVARMMAKKPEDRFESMEVLGQAIRSDLAGVTLSDEAGLESPRRLVPVAAAPEPQAPLVPEGPTQAELEESPTMPLPRQTMAPKTRNTLLAAGGGIALLAIVVGAVVLRSQASDLARQARQRYNEGVIAYDSGTDYALAAEVFEDVRANFPDTVHGQQASVMAPLAAAWVAAEHQEWDVVSEHEQDAKDRLKEFDQSHGDRFDVWIGEQREELTSLEDFRLQQRRYYGAMNEARSLLTERRYEDALDVIRARLSNLPLTAQQSSDLAAFRETVYRTRLVQQRDALAREVEFAIANNEYILAADLIAQMQDILESEDIRYISAEQLEQWDRWRRETAASVDTERAVEQFEREIEEARRRKEKSRELFALRALDKLRPSDDLKAQIKKVEADVIYEDAVKYYNEGDLVRASDLLVQIHEDSRAQALLGVIANESKLAATLKEADRLFANGQWTEAKDLYDQLVQDAPSPKALDRINTCRFEIAVQNGDDALAEAIAALGNDHTQTEAKLTEARSLFRDAAGIDSSRQARDIAPRINDISRLSRIADALAQGDELLTEKDWNGARAAFEKAIPSCDTPQETKLVEARIGEADYGKFMQLGVRDYQAGIYAGAKVMFERAQDIQDTEEVRDWLDRVARAILEEGDE